MKSVKCETCQEMISENNFSRHACLIKFNWDSIQKYYDSGFPLNKVCKKFKLSDKILKRGKKKGFFKTRNRFEAIKMAEKMGRRDYKSLWTPDRKKKQSELKKIFYKKYPEKHPNRILANNRIKMSFPERMVYDYLKKEEISFIHNAPILKYFVDFLIGNVGIEVDGEKWHDKIKDSNRDSEILSHENIRIIRIPAKIIIKQTPVILSKILNLDDKKEIQYKIEEFLNNIEENRKKEQINQIIEMDTNNPKLIYNNIKSEINIRCKTCNRYFCYVPNKPYIRYCSHKCASFSNRKIIWPSKQQLRKDIKKFSVVHVGKKYGVSDNAVRKWCKSYGMMCKCRLYPSKKMLKEDLKNNLPFNQIAKKYSSNSSTIKLRIVQHGLELPKRQKNKLIKNQVVDIKQKMLMGITNIELSKEYKVAPNTISEIRTGVSWKNIKPD